MSRNSERFGKQMLFTNAPDGHAGEPRAVELELNIPGLRVNVAHEVETASVAVSRRRRAETGRRAGGGRRLGVYLCSVLNLTYKERKRRGSRTS